MGINVCAIQGAGPF